MRSGLLLQTILPALKQRSDEMAAQLKQLNDMQAQETIKSQELNSVTQDQLTKKGMLSRLYAIKSSQSGAQPQVEFDKKLLMSSSMEQLLNYVNLRKTAGQEMKQAVAQLALKPPVQGKLLTLYDQQKQYFAHSQGAVIEARSGAQVIAPVESQVVFSGPFREYGNLLILRTQDNYHVVLMGLSKLDVAVGQDVLGGEPIGEMGATEGKVLLGLELRKNTRIIDPTPWVMQWNR